MTNITYPNPMTDDSVLAQIKYLRPHDIVSFVLIHYDYPDDTLIRTPDTYGSEECSFRNRLQYVVRNTNYLSDVFNGAVRAIELYPKQNVENELTQFLSTDGFVRCTSTWKPLYYVDDEEPVYRWELYESRGEPVNRVLDYGDEEPIQLEEGVVLEYEEHEEYVEDHEECIEEQVGHVLEHEQPFVDSSPIN